jgi:hypothetical protein
VEVEKMTIGTDNSLTIRRLGESDADLVARLAELDTGVVPAAPLLGAEVEGRLLAAISLRDGEAVADPFSRTAELRSMLELRASQLRARPRSDGRLLRTPHDAALAPTRPARRFPGLHPRAS